MPVGRSIETDHRPEFHRSGAHAAIWRRRPSVSAWTARSAPLTDQEPHRPWPGRAERSEPRSGSLDGSRSVALQAERGSLRHQDPRLAAATRHRQERGRRCRTGEPALGRRRPLGPARELAGGRVHLRSPSERRKLLPGAEAGAAVKTFPRRRHGEAGGRGAGAERACFDPRTRGLSGSRPGSCTRSAGRAVPAASR